MLLLQKIVFTSAASWVAAHAHHQLENSIMSELILKSGPTLLWRQREYVRVTDEERYIDLDVTTVAHEFRSPSSVRKATIQILTLCVYEGGVQ